MTLLAVALAWLAGERRQSAREIEAAAPLIAQGLHVDIEGLLNGPGDNPWWRRALSNLIGFRVTKVGLERFNDQDPLLAPQIA